MTEEIQRTFPGCYSVMHDIKQAQRYAEHLLQQADRAIGCWAAAEQRADHRATIGRAWDDLLFTEFHDVLAGTSIPGAWESVRAMQGRARIMGEEVISDVTRGWSRKNLPRVNHQQIILFNADPEPFEEVFEHEPFLDFDAWGNRWISDLEGRPIEYQIVSPQAALWLSTAVLFPAHVPAAGVQQLLIRDDARPARTQEQPQLHANAIRLANDVIEVALNPAGIGSIAYRNRPVVSGAALQLREDISDTWIFGSDTFAGTLAETFTADTPWVVEESGPLRARARLEGRIGRSTVRWTVSVFRGQAKVDVMLEINFAERLRLLQMPISLAAKPKSRRDGLAGGAVDRDLEMVEFPLQGWSRVRVDDVEVGVVTQDAYSLSLRESTAWWTLLRSPRMACFGGTADLDYGRMSVTDQGAHRFEFTIVLGPELSDKRLERLARQRARLPVAFDRYEGMARPPWKNSPPERLWTGLEQRAMKDGRMSHLKTSGTGGQGTA